LQKVKIYEGQVGLITIPSVN